jgi:sec-independent protein translocase protein TatA
MGLGMSEVVLILVIALVIFGPRKLPELGKSLGQAMNQFRKASDEFKRTWEQEVELEKVRKSDTPALADGSGYNYDSHHGDSGYGTDPDFNYGYDTASNSSGNSSSNSASATEPASQAVPEAAAVAAAATTEKKAEPHWI